MGIRDVKKLPPGSHQFTVLIPDNPKKVPKRFRPLLRNIGDGRKGFIVGAYNDKGRLIAKINQEDDDIATKQKFDPKNYISKIFPDFDTAIPDEAVELPPGIDNDTYVEQALNATMNFRENEAKNNIPYDFKGKNSNTFNQTLHESLGGKPPFIDYPLRQDWGARLRFPHDLYSPPQNP